MSKRGDREKEYKKNYGWNRDKLDEGDWDTSGHWKTEGQSSASKWSKKKDKGESKKGDGRIWKPKPKPPSTPPPEDIMREHSAPSSSANPSSGNTFVPPWRQDRDADESRGRSRRREPSDDQRALKTARTPSSSVSAGQAVLVPSGTPMPKVEGQVITPSSSSHGAPSPVSVVYDAFLSELQQQTWILIGMQKLEEITQASRNPYVRGTIKSREQLIQHGLNIIRGVDLQNRDDDIDATNEQARKYKAR